MCAYFVQFDGSSSFDNRSNHYCGCDCTVQALSEVMMREIMITFGAGVISGVIETVIYYHVWSRLIAKKLMLTLREADGGRS